VTQVTPLELVRRYRSDPVAWVRDVLGFELTGIQQDVIRAVATERTVAVKSCHAIGKSFMSACAALWFLYNHRPSKVITTAPTQRQVVGILWSEVGRLHAKARLPLPGKPNTQQLTIAPDWFAWGFTAPDYDQDRFQGFHSENLLVIVDEAAGVTSQIFAGIEALTTGSRSKLLLIGNPTVEASDFGKAFKSDAVRKFTISAFDTPNLKQFGITMDNIKANNWKEKITGPLPWPTLVSAEWVRDRFEKWGEHSPMFESRVLARFPRQADDVLVPLSWAEQAQARWDMAQARGWSGPYVMGLDVARLGPDSTVAALACPQGIRALIRLRKGTTTETAGLVLETLRTAPGVREVRVDADGLGAGVFDTLHEQLGDKVIEMRGGMSARDKDRFVNRRSEWLWNLRERLDPDKPDALALPFDDRLTAQLTSIRWAVNRKGLIQVEPKDEMKKRLGESPDELDSIAYALADGGTQTTVAVDPTIGYGGNQWSL